MARIEVKREEWRVQGRKHIAYVGRIFSEHQKMVVYQTHYCQSRQIAKEKATLVFNEVAEPACRLYDGTTWTIVPFAQALQDFRHGKLSPKITADDLDDWMFMEVFIGSKEIYYYARKVV